MRIALFGASGRIGAAVLTQALAQGHEVRLLARDPARLPRADRLEVVVGDARDGDAVARVVAGADAVVSAIGPHSNTPDAVALLDETARNIVSAMHAHGVKRVVFVAGAGLAIAGERRSLTQRTISGIVGLVARWVVAAKRRELAVFRESDLDWTAVRPPRVVPGAATGRARLTRDEPRGFRVTSGDVAVAILTALTDPDTIREAPYVSSGLPSS